MVKPLLYLQNQSGVRFRRGILLIRQVWLFGNVFGKRALWGSRRSLVIEFQLPPSVFLSLARCLASNSS